MQWKTRFAMVLSLAAGAALTTPAAAQVFTPTFMSPVRSADVGVYLSDGPGDLGVEGIWRNSRGNYDLGLRLGVADTEPDAAVLLGAEVRSPLQVDAAPLDFALTGGAQGIFGGVDVIGVQGGLTVGGTFVPGPGLSLTPYLHPRVAVITGLGDGNNDFELDLLADFGVDIGFSPDLSFRLGVALGETGSELGVGIAWR